jgi:hypothetical protein
MVVMIILAIICPFFLFAGFKVNRNAKRSLTRTLDLAEESYSWPTVIGIVKDAWIEGGGERSGFGDDLGSSGSYEPRISYEYQVNGVRYYSSRLCFGSNRKSSKESAEGSISYYPVDKPVNVFYNPRDPETSTLQPGMGPSYSILSPFFLSIFLFFVGTFAGLIALIMGLVR